MEPVPVLMAARLSAQMQCPARWRSASCLGNSLTQDLARSSFRGPSGGLWQRRLWVWVSKGHLCNRCLCLSGAAAPHQDDMLHCMQMIWHPGQQMMIKPALYVVRTWLSSCRHAEPCSAGSAGFAQRLIVDCCYAEPCSADSAGLAPEVRRGCSGFWWRLLSCCRDHYLTDFALLLALLPGGHCACFVDAGTPEQVRRWPVPHQIPWPESETSRSCSAVRRTALTLA